MKRIDDPGETGEFPLPAEKPATFREKALGWTMGGLFVALFWYFVATFFIRWFQ